MYDRGSIIIGLGVFLGLFTFPIWYAVGSGSSAERPELQLPTEQGPCIESTEYMRGSHMDLLSRWRDQVVREGSRSYTASDGRVHQISLTETCLGCHAQKEQFCEKCHDYTGVQPACWECHIVPQGN
jgi:hypothetical protein